MSYDKTTAALTIGIALVACVAGVQVLETVADDQSMAEYYNESEQWCNDRGGELFSARVIGDHGGLHCVLENGTHVHMDDVVEVAA